MPTWSLPNGTNSSNAAKTAKSGTVLSSGSIPLHDHTVAPCKAGNVSVGRGAYLEGGQIYAALAGQLRRLAARILYWVMMNFDMDDMVGPFPVWEHPIFDMLSLLSNIKLTLPCLVFRLGGQLGGEKLI